MNQYIFSVGLIPVQEWIAQARRSRDLKAGSVFLWFLMHRALHRLTSSGAKIVVPRFKGKSELSFGEAMDQTYGIPNRATGLLTAPSEGEVAGRFANLEARLEEDWRGWRDQHLQPSGGKEERAFWSHLVEPLRQYRQRLEAMGGDNPFSLVWAARREDSPIDPEDEASLRGPVKRIGRLFDEIKRSRPIRPWVGAPIGKCNQCGAREAIGPEDSFEDWKDWHQEVTEDNDWIEREVRFSQTERLCYVCLARRMAGYVQRNRQFPSTGEIAIKPWRERVEDEPEGEELFNGLAKSGLPAEGIPRALLAPRAEDGETAREALEAWKRARLGNPKLVTLPERPNGTLALLCFDGDDMGKKVPDAPVRIPKAMESFAKQAATKIDGAGGEAFYLGGDEGLAMAPAERALDLAHALRDVFEQSFEGLGCTLSCGVVFFSYALPLGPAIESAHAVLEAAKDRPGKNALAAGLQTGEGLRWCIAEGWGAFWERIRGASRLVEEGELASKWAHEAAAMARRLEPAAWSSLASDLDVPRAELVRLFRRKVLPKEGEARGERKQRKDALWQRIGGAHWWAAHSPGESPLSAGEAPRLLPEQFDLIAFLARQALSPEGDPAAAAGGGA